MVVMEYKMWLCMDGKFACVWTSLVVAGRDKRARDKCNTWQNQMVRENRN